MRMGRALGFVFVLFFICGLFVSLFGSVGSASGLVEDSWVSKAPMNQARDGLGVVAVNGKIYAIGGSTENHKEGFDNAHRAEFVGTNECYDPVTDTWVTLADMPTPRSNFAIAAYQGKIYCIGGINGTKLDDHYGMFPQIVYCDIVEVYDIAANSWSTRASVPYSTYRMSAASVVGGKIFFVRVPDCVCYDPIADTWTNKTRMPTGSPYGQGYYPVSVVVDNKIVVTSNIDFGFSSGGVRGVFVYDSRRDVWREGENRGRIAYLGGAGATTGVYAPKKIYVMGNIFYGNNPDVIGVNRVYDVSGDSWSDGAGMLTPRLGFGVAVVDDIVYVVGGRTDYEFVSALNEAYIPIGYSSVPRYWNIAVLVLTAGAGVVVSVLYFKKLSNREKTKSINPYQVY